MKKLRQFSSPLEITRAEIVESKGILEGYFITYNAPAECGNYGFYEMVAPEAGEKALGTNRDIRCFYNHNYDLVLGRQSNNTLMLKSDEKGLWGRVELNMNDSQARDIFERVKRQDISGCSFGAYLNEEELVEFDGKDVFVLRDMDLIEVSVCPLPFYDSTTMEARSKQIEERQKTGRLRKILEERYGLTGDHA